VLRCCRRSNLDVKMISILRNIVVCLVVPVLVLVSCDTGVDPRGKNDTIIKDDPCLTDMKNRVNTILKDNPNFDFENGILFRFSFLCEDSARLRKFNEHVSGQFKRDSVEFDWVQSDLTQDSLYRVEWFQVFDYSEPRVYCEQLHYLNYMSQRYWLSRYSNLKGTIVVKP
jgi:hypothetical protein